VVIGRAQGGHEQLHGPRLPGDGVKDVEGVAGEVDKNLLARDMGLAHGRAGACLPGLVLLAKPGIAEAAGVSGTILLPKKRPRDAAPSQLAFDMGPIGDRPLVGGRACRRK